jgi:hypothetical protein
MKGFYLSRCGSSRSFCRYCLYIDNQNREWSYKKPSVQTMAKIAKVLDATADELLKA